jgi:UDP-N-acetyl-D-glucosamine dehydrogenase
VPSGKLAIIGQGYVGLPISMRAVEVGYDVVGLDVDPTRIGLLTSGDSYVEDVEPETVEATLATGRFKPTTEESDLAGFDFAIITVPTPLRDTLPDLTFIEDASASLAKHLTPGATVVVPRQEFGRISLV